MIDPYLIEESWNDGVKDRKRQGENNVSAMLKTYVAVARAIEDTEGLEGARRTKGNREPVIV